MTQLTQNPPEGFQTQLAWCIQWIYQLRGRLGSGGGSGESILLQTDSTNNAVQTLLNLLSGSGITLTDNGDGSVTIDNTGSGGIPTIADVLNQGNNAGSIGQIFDNGTVSLIVTPTHIIINNNTTGQQTDIELNSTTITDGQGNTTDIVPSLIILTDSDGNEIDIAADSINMDDDISGSAMLLVDSGIQFNDDNGNNSSLDSDSLELSDIGGNEHTLGAETEQYVQGSTGFSQNIGVDTLSTTQNLLFPDDSGILVAQHNGNLLVTGTNGQTIYNIPHGLPFTPSFASISAKNSPTATLLAGGYYLAYDDTNIGVILTVATIGTPNLSIDWFALKLNGPH